MQSALRSLQDRFDRRTLAFLVRINVYEFGLILLWTVMDTALLPVRVESTVRHAVVGTALGTISFLGVGLAAIVQPIAGRVSDVWPGHDRRRPFIIAGTLCAVPGLVLFSGANVFALLLLGYVLMQLSTNVSQAAFQAFIPDLVKEDEYGIASGIRNVFSVLAGAVGLIGARVLYGLFHGGNAAVEIYIGAVFVATGILTLLWVPHIPGIPSDDPRGAVRHALNPRHVWDNVARTLRQHPAFRRGVIAQFLFMLGLFPAQRFLLIFLRDRFGNGAINWATTGGTLAILLAVVAAGVAGALSDAIGRRRVLIASAVIGSVGLALFGFAPTLWFVAIAGGMIAIGLGAFQAVNWALLSDDLPEGQAAESLGVANIATAGAGALAGLFGPVVDIMNATFPTETYDVLFGLCAIVAALAIIPLRRIGPPAAAVATSVDA